MFSTRILASLAFVLLVTISQAQFANVLLNQKPRPRVTKTEIDGDSVNYIDKQNNFSDRREHVTHSVWTEFAKFKSSNRHDSSVIMYSRIETAGKGWTPPVRISAFAGDCSNSDSTLKSDVPCAGPGKDVYVCWAGPGGIYFQRSADLGNSWLQKEIYVAPLKNGWDQQVKFAHVTGIPRIACVTDSSEYTGRIYICWSDEKNGITNKDVFLVYSDDKGESWTEPILVTYRPNHKEQFYPAISIQPGTGSVFLTYFSTENYFEGNLYDLMLAISKNGGLQYEYYRLNEKPLLLDSTIIPVRGLAFAPKSTDARAIWSQTEANNMLSLYSAMITDSSITAYLEKEKKNEIQVERSFAFAKKIPITFITSTEGKLTVTVTKPLEPEKKEMVLFKDKLLTAGINAIVIDTKKSALIKGNYILNFYFNNRHTFIWLLGE